MLSGRGLCQPSSPPHLLAGGCPPGRRGWGVAPGSPWRGPGPKAAARAWAVCKGDRKEGPRPSWVEGQSCPGQCLLSPLNDSAATSSPSGQLFSQKPRKQIRCVRLVTTQPFPWCPSEKARSSASPRSSPWRQRAAAGKVQALKSGHRPGPLTRETLLPFPHYSTAPWLRPRQADCTHEPGDPETPGSQCPRL